MNIRQSIKDTLHSKPDRENIADKAIRTLTDAPSGVAIASIFTTFNLATRLDVVAEAKRACESFVLLYEGVRAKGREAPETPAV